VWRHPPELRQNRSAGVFKPPYQEASAVTQCAQIRGAACSRTSRPSPGDGARDKRGCEATCVGAVASSTVPTGNLLLPKSGISVPTIWPTSTTLKFALWQRYYAYIIAHEVLHLRDTHPRRANNAHRRSGCGYAVRSASTMHHSLCAAAVIRWGRTPRATSCASARDPRHAGTRVRGCKRLPGRVRP
jgi:hypothetical protein